MREHRSWRNRMGFLRVHACTHAKVTRGTFREREREGGRKERLRKVKDRDGGGKETRFSSNAWRGFALVAPSPSLVLAATKPP